MKYVGELCFNGTAVEEMTLPGTLRDVGKDVFQYCRKLKVIWVEEGCAIDVRSSVKSPVTIMSASQKAKGYTFLTSLKKQENIIIPKEV